MAEDKFFPPTTELHCLQKIAEQNVRIIELLSSIWDQNEAHQNWKREQASYPLGVTIMGDRR